MTREEAKQEFWRVSKSGGYTGVFERAFNIRFKDALKMLYHGSEFDKFIDKIYNSLEAQQQLKSCKSCKYVDKIENESYAHWLCCDKTGMWDMEAGFYCSYYELKDTK
jgi:hypothetical protein